MNATQAQYNFIKTLVGERDLTVKPFIDEDTTVEDLVVEARVKAIAGTLSKQEASTLINYLLAAPAKVQAVTSVDAPEGMHVLSGTVYKVQIAKRGSGNKYAKRLEQGADGKWSFEYAKGMIRHLSPTTIMSAQEAAQFGHLYGICCNCGADLTDETSIHFGYGPVCAKRNDWPYSKKAVSLTLEGAM